MIQTNLQLVDPKRKLNGGVLDADKRGEALILFGHGLWMVCQLDS